MPTLTQWETRNELPRQPRQKRSVRLFVDSENTLECRVA